MDKVTLFEFVGYASAAFNIYAAVSKTMVRLRSAAIIGNILALAFALHNGTLPTILVNAVVLPLNALRLMGMLRQIRAVQDSTEGRFNIEWLRPFMAEKTLPGGTVLFNRGDVADKAYFIQSGTITLPEIGKTLIAGQLFGEMGLISQGNQRSQTAVAAGPVELLSIDYSDFKELVLQNPEFGFYLMRLIVQRLEASQPMAQPLPA